VIHQKQQSKTREISTETSGLI